MGPVSYGPSARGIVASVVSPYAGPKAAFFVDLAYQSVWTEITRGRFINVEDIGVPG